MDGLALETLLPAAVRAVVRRIPEEELELTPSELEAVSRAVPKRRREFAAGRASAREALRSFGVEVSDLLRLPDGQVAWPEGFVGTISHTRSWCAAAVGRETDLLGLGLDIEKVGRMSAGAARHVMSANELERCDRSAFGTATAWTVTFSAKESIYKCLYPMVRRFIGFDEATIELLAGDRLSVSLDPALEAVLPQSSRLDGRYQVVADHVVTTMVLVAGS